MKGAFGPRAAEEGQNTKEISIYLPDIRKFNQSLLREGKGFRMVIRLLLRPRQPSETLFSLETAYRSKIGRGGWEA